MEYELLDWIDINKLGWNELCRNPNSMDLLEKNIERINWNWLSFNPNAIHILEKYPEKINWENLSCNPNAISLFDKKKMEYFDKNYQKSHLYLSQI